MTILIIRFFFVFSITLSSLDAENPEEERNKTVCIHDVEYDAVVFLPLEETLQKAGSNEPCHYEIQDMDEVFHEYHLISSLSKGM